MFMVLQPCSGLIFSMSGVNNEDNSEWKRN